MAQSPGKRFLYLALTVFILGIVFFTPLTIKNAQYSLALFQGNELSPTNTGAYVLEPRPFSLVLTTDRNFELLVSVSFDSKRYEAVIGASPYAKSVIPMNSLVLLKNDSGKNGRTSVLVSAEKTIKWFNLGTANNTFTKITFKNGFFTCTRDVTGFQTEPNGSEISVAQFFEANGSMAGEKKEMKLYVVLCAGRTDKWGSFDTVWQEACQLVFRGK